MTLCIIPARGGSKRIPRKNIKEFLGKPILAYSIEAALESECFDQVIVSTDDQEITQLSLEYGAQVPFIRPDELSDDFSNTFSVIKHAVEEGKIKDTESVCCLYATAPFIDADTLNDSYKKFTQSNANYCLGVTSFAFPIQRALRISNMNFLEMFNQDNSDKRSQDLAEAYHDAGQFCWGKASAFKQGLPLYTNSTIPYILKRDLVQDIDTNEDWLRAETLYKFLKLG